MGRKPLSRRALPPIPEPNLAAIPDELKRERRWLVWRRKVDPGSSGRFRKVPYNVADKPANHTDPREWRTFEDAVKQYKRGAYDGIAIALGDGLCGLDEDECLSPDGALDPVARSHIELVASYSEVSPSGTGVKTFAFGSLPDGRRKTGKHELYCDGRYFTVTGRHLPGTPSTVEQRGPELHELHRIIFGAGTSEPPGGVLERSSAVPEPEANTQGGECVGNTFSLSDEQVMGMLRRDRIAGTLLATGHTPGGDESAEDFAFACKLAFFTGRNMPQMDRIFRGSPLANRGKATSRRGGGDYITLTLERARSETKAVWKPGRERSGGKGKGGRPRCDVDPETVARLAREGMSFGMIAKELGISKTSAHRYAGSKNACFRVSEAFQNSSERESAGKVPVSAMNSTERAPERESEDWADCPRCGKVMGEKSIRGICQLCYWTQANHKRRFDGYRAEVVERDAGHCRVCGDGSDIIVHHRQPGTNQPNVLVTLCRACHIKVHRMKALYCYQAPLLAELWAEQHPQDWKQQQIPLENETAAGWVPLAGGRIGEDIAA